MTQTLTIAQLSQFSDAVYGSDGVGSPSGTGTVGTWLLMNANFPTLVSKAADGFVAQVWENQTTQEVVIAYRGTVPSNYATLEQDAYIAAGKLAPGATDAAALALQVQASLPAGYSLAVTGHSLGGYEAQYALTQLVDHGTGAGSPYATVFDAPGLSATVIAGLHHAPTYYSSVNFYAQGDAIHAAGIGAVQLGQLPAVSLSGVGPSISSEFSQAGAAFRLGLLGGLGVAIAAAAATLLYNWAVPAHSLNAILSSLGGPNGTNPTGNNVTIGNETEGGYLSANGATPPDPNLSDAANGATVIGDGTGSSLTVQVPNSSGAVLTSISGVSGDGVLVPAADQSALQSQVAADGSESAASQALATGVIASLESASRIYITESVTSTGAIGVTMGTTPLGSGTDAPGQLTIPNASTIGRFEYGLPATGQTATETIVGENNQDTVWVNNGQTYTQLRGGAASSVALDTWVDANGTQYVFSSAAGSSTGSLTITNGILGSNTQNSITIQNFNLATAQTASGYLGIVLPETLTLNASANSGISDPTPNFTESSNQSYTLSVDAPSTSSQTLEVTLSGAVPSDFEVTVGETVEQLNADGSFAVTLAAGETNVAFTLTDTTQNGSSDIASGATLELSASLPNAANPSGPPVQAAPFIFNYIPTYPIDSTAPNTIQGTLVGGVTDYVGDHSNDFVSAGNGPNNINLAVSLNDTVVGNNNSSVILTGDGTNQIYAGSQTTVANAIAAASTAVATGLQGDLIAAGHGNNTIIGSNGNDFITSDDSFPNGAGGNDLIVLGAGNDTYVGGIDITGATSNWSVTHGSTGTSVYYIPSNISSSPVGYFNPYNEDYNGNETYTSPSQPLGGSNATIFGGTGNYFLLLGNGNNYVDVGSGNSTVGGGMGNDTIIAGSGTEVILGGGGTSYVAGGSGAESIFGGDGNNTIIGGSGNATIYSSTDGLAIDFPNDNLVQNYVTGGSGNDVIYGSAGSDTLIGGTGNVTIVGGSGSENIVGGSGNDVLSGGTGNVTIAAGGAGVDSLYAVGSSTSASVLYGGNGKDYIVGGSGSNTLYAGDGGTAGAATSVFASQSDTTATSTIYGGLGVDFLEGGIGASVIYAGNGGTSAAPTSVVGFSGNDTLYGGLGTDILQAGSGNTVLYAGDGGTSAAPTTVISGTGIDSLFGGAGPGLLQDLSSGQDLLVAGTSNDTLVGMGNDTLVAGSGNDVLQTNGGSTYFEFNPGFGNDTILANGGTVNLLLGTGVLGTDFTGSVTQDLQGGFDLVLTGDGGSISIQNALAGTLLSAAYADPTSIPLPTLIADAFGTADESIPIFSSINSLIGNVLISTASAETLNPNTLNETISSWGNNDTINANQTQMSGGYYLAGSASVLYSIGSDTIIAAGSNDTINASGYNDSITISGANALLTLDYAYPGTNNIITVTGLNDTISVNSSSGQININSSSTVVQSVSNSGMWINSSVSYTAPATVTNLTLTGTANITATGNGNLDVLTGGAGNDTLIAGSGLATLYGGNGNTTYVINNASDAIQAYINSPTANDTLQSSVSYTLPTYANTARRINTLQLTGTAALVGTANDANDTLISNSGVDTLIGGAGNDTFILNNPNDVVIDTAGSATIQYAGASNYTLPTGINLIVLTGTAAVQVTGNSAADTLISNTGVDTLVGGSGNDTFVVNNSLDVVQDTTTSTTNTLQSSVSYSLPANVNTLTLIGTAALSATGNSAANILTANSGNDTLTAGAGVATLVGGAGSDTFVVNSASDVVRDTVVGANNTLVSSVSATLGTNINTLVLTGTGSLTGTANNGPDTLISNSGVDTLVGGAGNDTFVINNASDVVQDPAPGAKNSINSAVSYTLPSNVNALTLTGTAALVATGNAASDVLTANSGADTLVAGTGNDTLISGSGASVDQLIGGTGADLFVVNNSSDIVTVNGAHGADTIQSSVNYTLPRPVNTLLLNGSANLVGAALSGNNSIIGNSGNDILKAGSGADTLVAGSAVDTLIGGAGSDTFVLNNAGDVLQSLSTAGNSVVASFNYTLPINVNALILSGTTNLSATGNSLTDSITANGGNDTLTAGTGIATFNSGQGSDLFVINNASDQVLVPNVGVKFGIDTIDSSVSYTVSSVSTLVLTGTANLSASENAGKATILIGNAGLDTLMAGAGTDTLIAGSGTATLVGGASNDTFVVNSTSDVVRDTVSGHSNVLISSVNFTLPTNVNAMVLTGSSALVATGNSANDSLVGNAGADTLVAGAGTDTLVAGIGLATMLGGTGSDTFVVNNGADVIQGASASSSNMVRSSANYVLPTNVNQLTLTGVANISGTGNTAIDTLIGGAGNDTLIAGSNATTLIGGLGNTTFVINSSADVVQDGSTTASNVVQSSVSYSLGSNVNGLVLTGTTALKGTANSGNDTLTSNAGADTLVGGSGNDIFIVTNAGDVVQDSSTTASNIAESSISYTLTANVNSLILLGTAALTGTANSGSDTLTSNVGVDTLIGGVGNETFIVNNALDAVVDTSATATNSIQSSVSFTLPVNVNSLTLTGTAPLTATGNAAADLITANSGNDTLTAGSGVATLVGGAGNVTFIVNSASDVVQSTAPLANDTLQSSVSYTLPSNVNTLLLTGSTNLVATANSLGKDVLVGNSGNDTLISNSQIDTLIGGSGNNVFVINNPADVILAGSGNNTVQTTYGYTLPASIANLTLTGTTSITGTLGSLNGVLTGNSGNDTLTTGSGNDTIYGGSGSDQISGGSGSDALYAGSGGTSVAPTYVYSGAGPTTLYGGSGFDALYPQGPATVVAGSGTGYVQMGTNTSYTPTIVLNSGFGTLQLGSSNNGSNFNLNFGTGISPSSLGVTATTVGGGFGLQITNGVSTFLDTISLFPITYPSEPLAGINAISFADSGSLTLAQLIAQAHSTSATLTSGASKLHFSVANSDSVTGGSGPDTISAWGNNDTLTGGTSSEKIYAGGNSEVVYAGSATSVTIAAPGLADTLYGGAGAATFYISDANDVLLQPTANGATDIISSSVSYSLPVNMFELNLTGTSALLGTANGDTDLANGYADAWISGNSGNDTLVASAGSDELFAGSGNQLLLGGSGSVTMEGGAGNDTLVAGTGVALEYAGTGNDLFVVDNSSDSVYGGVGNDTLESSVNFFLPSGVTTMILTGSADLFASDTVVGSNAIITANSGNDSLYAYQGVDTLVAGTGNDFIELANAADIVQIGAVHGNDTVQLDANASSFALLPNVDDVLVVGQVDSVTGNSGNDSMTSHGSNTLVAGSGTDTLVSSYGGDTLVGGSGNDVFIVGNNPGTVIQDSYTTTNNSVRSSASLTLPTNVNTLTLTGAANIIATGNAASDLLTANAGNDTLVSGSGVDTLVGGSGNDWYVLNNAADVIQNLSSGSNTIQAGFSYTLPTNANTLILSGTSNLAGTANAGNDTLTANTGIDTLTGGSGNDTFVINNASDVVVDTSTTASNIISSSVSYSLPTNVTRLILTGTSALVGTANSVNDTLTANSGADTLISGTGSAVDSLVGGTGSDLFIVNVSSDIVNVGSTHGNDTIQSSVSFNAASNVANLIFTGSSNVAGTGNSLADVITANSGNDTLTAGSGIATLNGGVGNDVFVINNTGDLVQNVSATTSNTVRSSVTYSLIANVNSLVLTGTTALKGTANSANDTLTSNTGLDTLVGGAGNDVFVISNASDVVQDTSTTAINIIQSSVTFSLPTNVNALTFTGSTALIGRGNAGNDSMTANTGADTLIAGNGTDTLVSSATGSAIDSLVGGTGNDLFVVHYTGDIVNVGSTHGVDTIQSSVSYTASANVANLTLTGTSNLAGTGNTLTNVIVANTGNDTLTAGTGVATLIGGSGNDTFVVNSASDVIQDTSTTASNVLSSSVTFTLPTNVNRLIFTGTSALVGTANSANDTLTANTGADTLVSGSGVDSLVGGTGANLFIVNNAADIVYVGSTHGVDTIQSSVSFTALANVANLTLTGTAALLGVGNSLAGTITANSGNDTLTAGTGADTLVGGIGTDTFVVNSASDVVSLTTSGTSDTIQSSAATYTLPTNVQYLMLTGTAALAGTGNTLLDLITGNTGNDTLTGGTGIAALEGGKTAGSDQIKATGNQAALIAGGGSSTLTGGAFKDFYAAGKVSDSITTGATANVISVNKGDGATALQPTTSATNVLSLGAGIDTESLFFTKTGNNLILTDGVSGDSITFTNWYVGTADQDYSTLQVVEIASASYNSAGTDGLRNKALEDFNFKSLVAAYNTAGSPANWALSTAMPSAQLTSSSTADYGGDLAYYFGLNGNLTGVDLSAVQSTLTNASFGTAAQTIDSFSSISGGGGLHLLTVKQGSGNAQPSASPQSTGTTDLAAAAPTTSTETATDAVTVPATASTPTATKTLAPATITRLTVSSEPLASTVPSGGTEARLTPRILMPRRGIERPIQDPASSASSAVTASAVLAAVTGLQSRRSIEPLRRTAIDMPVTRSYVDPINVAWLRMHGALDETSEVRMGAEATTEHEEVGTEGLLGSAPLSRTRRLITDPEVHSPLARQRAM